MKKLIVAALAVMLIAPRMYAGALVPSIGASLIQFTSRDVELDVRVAGSLFVVRANGRDIAYGMDPSAKMLIPFGTDIVFRPLVTTSGAPIKAACVVAVSRVDGKIKAILGEMNPSGTIEVNKEAWTAYYNAINERPGLITACLLVEFESAGRHETRWQILIFVVKGVEKYDVKRTAGIALGWDNWGDWRPNEPLPKLPEPRFLEDRITWNRAAEVSDVVPAGPEAGFDNLISKRANQLQPGNASYCRVRFQAGDGNEAEAPGTMAILFFTKKGGHISRSMPGSLLDIVPLGENRLFMLPEPLREMIKERELMPWLQIWRGSPRSATFVLTEQIRSEVAEAFPCQPGMRRALLCNVAGWEAKTGVGKYFDIPRLTERASDDNLTLVPKGATTGIERLLNGLEVPSDLLDDTYETGSEETKLPAPRPTRTEVRPAPKPVEEPEELK